MAKYEENFFFNWVAGLSFLLFIFILLQLQWHHRNLKEVATLLIISTLCALKRLRPLKGSNEIGSSVSSIIGVVSQWLDWLYQLFWFESG